MNFQRVTLRSASDYLNEVARSIINKFQADSVFVYIFDPKTKLLNLLVKSGKGVFLNELKTLKLGREMPYSITLRKSPILISGKKRFSHFSKIPGSLLAVPISINKSFCGLLLIHFVKKKFSVKLISSFNAETRLVGICLHSFDVLRSMSEEIAGLKVIDDINRTVATELNLERLYQRMYEQVKRIVRVGNLRIDLFDPENHRIKPAFFIYNGQHINDHPAVNIQKSIIFAEIFKKRKIMLTPEYKKLLNKFNQLTLNSDMKVSSFIALPLIVHDNFLGVIMCWDKNKKCIFSRRVVRLLMLMAGQSAIAIYNAKLFDQLNKAINDLTLLYQIEYHISSILSIEELLRTAISLIDSALENLITTILLPDEKNERLLIKTMTPNVVVKSGFESVPIYRGIVGEAMKKKKNIYAPDVEKDEHYVLAIEGTKSEIAIPLMAGAKILGIIDFQSKQTNRFDLMTIDLLDDIAHRIATFLENAILYERIEKSYTEAIRALVLAMEVKDSYTRGHSERVTELAIRVAESMDFTDGRKRILYWAGLLHDIGKIGISESILNKPGQLDEFEFAEIKRHPVEGAKMLEQIQGLKEIVPIIKHHHENFDGTGYPEGLKGEEIPLESRILAVCDVYDAMTTIRSYRRPFSKEGALRAIESFKGTRLDPRIVQKFTKIMRNEKSEGREK